MTDQEKAEKLERVITKTQFKIRQTEDEIGRLINRNDRRRRRIRELGKLRAEYMTLRLL